MICCFKVNVKTTPPPSDTEGPENVTLYHCAEITPGKYSKTGLVRLNSKKVGLMNYS